MPPTNRKVPDPIPSGPFQRWLNDRVLESSTPEVVELVGWGGQTADSGLRRLYRHRYGRLETKRGQKNGTGGKKMVVDKEVVSRAVVEDALHHASVHFEDVYPPEMYPALYEDIPLEDERWCPGCQESCTPIKSVCPWCEWSFKHLVALDEADELRDAA